MTLGFTQFAFTIPLFRTLQPVYYGTLLYYRGRTPTLNVPYECCETLNFRDKFSTIILQQTFFEDRIICLDMNVELTLLYTVGWKCMLL